MAPVSKPDFSVNWRSERVERPRSRQNQNQPSPQVDASVAQTVAPAAVETAAAPSPGKYVPPWLRNKNA